jgi:hypothetical protein
VPGSRSVPGATPAGHGRLRARSVVVHSARMSARGHEATGRLAHSRVRVAVIAMGRRGAEAQKLHAHPGRPLAGFHHS